jgi:hypothetical protein
VRDTLERQSSGARGSGVSVQVNLVTGSAARATIRDSVLCGNRTAALHAHGAEARVEGGVLRATRRGTDDLFGDGVAVVGGKGLPATRVDVWGAVLELNGRAGASFHEAGGSVRASLVRGNQLSVALERGADPTIEDNRFEGNARDDVAVGLGLDPVPPVEPLK